MDRVISRAAVRDYVARHAPTLEAAQATGRLARAKIDVRDAAEDLFDDAGNDERVRLRAMVEEEIEALCADMRLASITVQNQVERRTRSMGYKVICAIGAAIVVLVLCIAFGADTPVAGLLWPLVAAFATFSAL